MKKYSIRVLLLLPFFMFTLLGSETHSQSHISQQGAPCQGPIARATKLPASLVEIIVAFRGPVYVGGYSVIRIRSRETKYSCASAYMRIHEKRIGIHYVDQYRGYNLVHLWSHFHSFDFNKAMERSGYKTYRRSRDVFEVKEALDYLSTQEERTKKIRENHREIPMQQTYSMAGELNDAVIVARLSDRVEKIKKYPLKYGDFDSTKNKKSNCTIS